MDERVARQASAAGGDELWRALQPLRTTATWLMFGAHPDDEWNGLLAWLVLGRGIRAVFACATRGDGGQNALGPERGADLAALRSREMERAAREIGFGVRWLTPGGDDPIVDFGFSRSGADTLARWGERLLVERMARAIREVRPDAVSPTFLDVPGQHGHHRAVTQSLAPAMALAADPAWECRLPPHAVGQAYLPAFSGGGGTYDDELPPPPATVAVDLGARCPVLGASWAQVGEWSRRSHASQGMGRWIPDGPRPLSLHKIASPPDRDVPLDEAPRVVADAVDAALAAWPDRAAVAVALEEVEAALGREPPGPAIARKQRECRRAAALAAGELPTLTITPPILRAGGMARIVVSGGAAGWMLPPGWRRDGDTLRIPADAAPCGTLRDGWDPLGGNDILGATVGGVVIDPAALVIVAPAAKPRAPAARIVRRLGDPRPDAVPPGRTEQPLGLRLALGQAPHIGAFARIAPAVRATLGIDCAIDRGARVGVVAGETDRTLDWLTQLGIDASALDDDPAAFGGCDVVLVGMMAFGQRPALDIPALHNWVRAGGKLVTLYHRPVDRWDAATHAAPSADHRHALAALARDRSRRAGPRAGGLAAAAEPERHRARRLGGLGARPRPVFCLCLGRRLPPVARARRPRRDAAAGGAAGGACRQRGARPCRSRAAPSMGGACGRRVPAARQSRGALRRLTRTGIHAPSRRMSAPIADEIKSTTCYMCACRCGIDVHLQQGKIFRITGNPNHPKNRGVLCGKGAAGVMNHFSPARLRKPLKRVGPRGTADFAEIEWEEALAIATGWLRPIRETDPKRLAFFTGRDQSQALTGWWAAQFGTPNFAAHGGFCSVNMAAAGLYSIGGSFWEFGDPDWDQAKYFLMFGVAEDHDSNPIKIGMGKMKARGAKIVSLNPVRTGYSAIADEWIGIRPGTDGAFVLALVHELLQADRIDLDFLVRYANAHWLVIQAPGDADDGLFVRDEFACALCWDRASGRAARRERRRRHAADHRRGDAAGRKARRSGLSPAGGALHGPGVRA